jgi:integrase
MQVSVYFDKSKARWRFSFDRSVGAGRQRITKLLPKGWSKAQADKFDATETSRLYALASGVATESRLIDDAVLVYLQERAPNLKNKSLTDELARCFHAYTGRDITDLAAVCREYAANSVGTLAPGTIRNRIAYLRAACRYAWKHHGYCEHDPASRLVVPPVSNSRKVYLSRAQMLAICRLIPHPQARAAARVAFYSGMRQAEIRRAVLINGLFVLTDTKNGDARHIPVHHKLQGIVRKVWPITITGWTISHHFTRATRKAGMPWATFHTLRHSTASEMINAGIALNTVGEVLGHRSAASTRRYAHLQTAALKGALATVGRKVA